jgi:hypothetical protein
MAISIQPELVLLSWGGGQDSSALLELYIKDQSFRKRFAPGRFLVVMAATGDEHPETNAHVQNTIVRCKELGVEFVHITGDMGFHTGDWAQGLHGQWRAHNTIGSASYPASCSASLKIEPIYKYLEYWIEREYGFKAGRKKGLRQFVEKFGKIRVLIGIAKGEEKRVAKAAKPLTFDFIEPVKDSTPKWMTYCIDRVYPLIELGLDRAGCQAYLRSQDAHVPPPSNCIKCAYKSKQEVLWTKRFLPVEFAEWVELETNKRAHWAGRVDSKTGLPVPNHGVKGLKTLVEFLAEAEAEYGHMTDAELDEYRFSHGHCVSSKY